MIKKLFIAALVCLFSFSFAQKKKKARDLTAELHLYSYGEIDKNFKPIPLQKRIAKFPFNKAAKVTLISYNLNSNRKISYIPPPPPEPKTKSDSVNVAQYHETYKNDVKPFDIKELIEKGGDKGIQESRTLTLTEISELTHILYNTCGKYYTGITSTTGCFFPRNAILLYDEHDKIFAYFDICFECDGIETSPREMLDIADMCEFLYPDLKKFFQNKGLTTDYVEKK